jgi:hypothetical protein
VSAQPATDYEPIRELYERFAEDGVDAFDLVHPDAVFHQNPEFPGERLHRGREGFRAGVAEFLAEWDDFGFEPLEHEIGDRVWVRVRIGGRGRVSQIPLNLEVFHVWELRDGQPFSCRVLLGEAESRREAGLAE